MKRPRLERRDVLSINSMQRRALCAAIEPSRTVQ